MGEGPTVSPAAMHGGLLQPEVCSAQDNLAVAGQSSVG